MSKLAELETVLKSKGYKITPQRKAILTAFIEAGACVLTAQDIYDKVKLVSPGTNFSTVYRNLELLLQESIIRKVELKRDASYYELVKPDGHHHHLICNKCGSIQTTDYCPLKDLKDYDVDGFVAVDHQFEIYGYCKECIKSLKKK